MKYRESDFKVMCDYCGQLFKNYEEIKNHKINDHMLDLE